MAKTAKPKATKQIDAIKHKEAKRKNIPTAELQSAAQRAEEINPVQPVVYKRKSSLAKGETRQRDTDLDPQMVWKGARIRLDQDQIAEIAKSGFIDIDEAQIVWRGKDQQDWSDLVVHAPPLYIQEKIHPKAIIDDLARQTEARKEQGADTFDLFHDFNGIDPEAKTEFYEHDQNWSNRMILGDSLQIMASLAEREGLRGQVQCIYFDPPYGIKFNSNWQVSTRSRDVKDGKMEEITREPEQVKAFRDTWKDGIHSYMTYLRDRLTAMRDLLTESGSIFVQIGDENVHRVRTLMDEVFGEENAVALIPFIKTSGKGGANLDTVNDYIIWYARSIGKLKYRQLYNDRSQKSLDQGYTWLEALNGERARLNSAQIKGDEVIEDGRRFITAPLNSQSGGETTRFPVFLEGQTYTPRVGFWKTNSSGMENLKKANRLIGVSNTLSYVRYADDFPVVRLNNFWSD